MNKAFWKDFRECFQQIREDREVRAVLVTGSGKIFTGGLDVSDHADTLGPGDGNDDAARKAFQILKSLDKYQDTFTAIERCPQPVIAAVHSACVGGGMDLISACDMRICTTDAWFSVKEVDVGLAADTGTLQRLPKIVGSGSLVRELVYTGRKLTASGKRVWLGQRCLPGPRDHGRRRIKALDLDCFKESCRRGGFENDIELFSRPLSSGGLGVREDFESLHAAEQGFGRGHGVRYGEAACYLFQLINSLSPLSYQTVNSV